MFSTGSSGGGGGGLQIGTGMFALLGQSNMWGQGAAAGGGSANLRGADQGYGISLATPFAPVTMNQRTSNGPTTPMAYADTGTGPLAPYTGSSPNMGPEQTLGRWLVNYGVYPSPALVKFAVGSTRLDVHWLSQFPSGTATTMYQDAMQQLTSRRTELNRQYDGLVWLQGEADEGTSAAANAYQANLGVFFGRVRGDLGIPNLPVFIVQVNQATGFGPFRDTVRAAQAAYVASDPNAYLVNVDDIFIEADPHYGMIGLADIGERCALAIKNALKPQVNTNLGTGVYYQQAAAGCTAPSGGFSFPRTGADTQVGDREYLVATCYPNTGSTVQLISSASNGPGGAAGDAGFTQVTSSFFSQLTTTNRRVMQVWERIISPTTPTASNGRYATPTVFYASGSSNLNVARIFDIRGGATGSTTNFVVAANNANNTSLIFPSITSSVSQSLAVGFVATAGANNAIKSITNAAFSNISIKWDSIYNPGAGFIQLGMFTAQLINPGAYGPTTIAFTGSGVNVGFMSIVSPA